MQWIDLDMSFARDDLDVEPSRSFGTLSRLMHDMSEVAMPLSSGVTAP